MSLTISAGSGKDFEIHPVGMFAARCTRVIDLGTQDSEYLGQKKRGKKVMIAFETTELMTEGEFEGRPFLMTNRYTASLHEKAALRKILVGWRSREFTEDELKAFDLKNILGKVCLLNIVHNKQKDGKVFANIASVNPLPAGMPPPKAGPTISFTIADADMTIYSALSKNVQETIAKSPEWQERGKVKVSEPAVDDLDDSDIPF